MYVGKMDDVAIRIMESSAGNIYMYMYVHNGEEYERYYVSSGPYFTP